MAGIPLKCTTNGARKAERSTAGTDSGWTRNGCVGGQRRAQQVTIGFPIVHTVAEPGVYPIQPRAHAEVNPQQLPTNSKWRITARGAAATNPHEGAAWRNALDQAAEGWLDAPFPFDEEGKLPAGSEPQLINPARRCAFRLGTTDGRPRVQGEKLGRPITSSGARLTGPRGSGL